MKLMPVLMLKWLRVLALDRKTSTKVRRFKLPRLILWLLPFVDSLAIRFLNLKPLRRDTIGTINIRIKRYRGRSIRLECGTEIKPGDLLIELHLNNAWFLHQRKIAASFTSQAWALVSAFTDDLRYLAKQLAAERFSPEIKALYSVPPFHAAAPRLGFTVLEMPQGLRKFLNQFYFDSLRQAYYLGGAERLITRTTPLEPKEMWISRVKFLQKYGPKETEES